MFKNLKDKWLVKQFLIYRNESAFNQLYKAHHLSLYRIALQLSNGDTSLAEELVQETWLRAIEGLKRFKWESELRTWLISILINSSREHNRKQQTFEFLDESLMEIKTTIPAYKTNMDIQKALTFLPPGYRMVVVLHDIEGYKHAEIGELLNISEGTSKSQLFNARKFLKKILQ